MNAVNDKSHKPVKPLSDVPARSVGTVVSEADALQQQAEDAHGEQQALLEASPLESQYAAALEAQVEAKHDQVERIEVRLEGVIEQQEAKLHQIEAKHPVDAQHQGELAVSDPAAASAFTAPSWAP